jgi:hypothetical protein
MKITNYIAAAKGSQLVYQYEFDNGYTAEHSLPTNPYGGDILMVFDKEGSFASDSMKSKASKLIANYHN